MSEEPPTPPPETDTLMCQALASRDVPCTHCGHNLRDNTSSRCPECGSQLRIVVEADRLSYRAWVPTAVLALMACGAAAAATKYVALLIDLFGRFNVSFTRAAARPGKPSAYMPWWTLVDASVSVGVAIAAAIGAVMAWHAFRRRDRAGTARAVWRCAVIGAILSIQTLVSALSYLLPRLF